MKNLEINEVWARVRRNKLIKTIGFTLLEVLVSIAIVGILSGIAVPLYAEYIEKAKIARASAEILIISARITSFHADRLQYPASLNEVGFATLLDPWGSPYQYLNIQTAKGNGPLRKLHGLVPINTDYDLYSMGKDGQSSPPLTAKASRDDIIRANDGAYIGRASNL